MPILSGGGTSNTQTMQHCPKNFIIILGGVGIYNPKDPAHDQGWSHFFAIIQVGFNKGIIKKDSHECVTWLVNGQAYRDRFVADGQVKDKTRTQYQRGFLKHKDTKYGGEVGYIARIRQWIAGQGHHFIDVSSESDVYAVINNLKDETITRIYFSGHASDNGLWLDLTHNSSNEAVTTNYLKSANLANALASKADKKSKKISKLYGCSSANTAKTIADKTGLTVEGAINAIHFGYIDSDIDMGSKKKINGNHLDRIENGSINGIQPNWQQY